MSFIQDPDTIFMRDLKQTVYTSAQQIWKMSVNDPEKYEQAKHQLADYIVAITAAFDSQTQIENLEMDEELINEIAEERDQAAEAMENSKSTLEKLFKKLSIFDWFNKVVMLCRQTGQYIGRMVAYEYFLGLNDLSKELSQKFAAQFIEVSSMLYTALGLAIEKSADLAEKALQYINIPNQNKGHALGI